MSLYGADAVLGPATGDLQLTLLGIEPAFVNARGKRWTRDAIRQHVIPPAVREANRQRAGAGLSAIREEATLTR